MKFSRGDRVLSTQYLQSATVFYADEFTTVVEFYSGEKRVVGNDTLHKAGEQA